MVTELLHLMFMIKFMINKKHILMGCILLGLILAYGVFLSFRVIEIPNEITFDNPNITYELGNFYNSTPQKLTVSADFFDKELSELQIKILYNGKEQSFLLTPNHTADFFRIPFVLGKIKIIAVNVKGKGSVNISVYN